MTKTFKKLLCLFFTAIIALSFTSVAFAGYAVGTVFTTDDEYFTCTVIESGKVKITQYSESFLSVTIPETVKDSAGNSYTVTALGDDIFEGNKVITSLSIPGTIKSIGNEMFLDFSSLETLTLNEGLETIGNSAFWNCQGITSVNIPDSVRTIGSNAFGDCKELTTVTVGSGVTTIPGTAFDMCTSLETVYLGKNVTSVNATAFRGCNALTDIYAYDKLDTFPIDSVDIDSVTFHCYPDTALYDFLTSEGANVAPYAFDRLVVTVDAEKQKYKKTDSVTLHKDGVTIVAKYTDAPDRTVTELCTLSTTDDFSVAGKKTVTAKLNDKSATYTVSVFDISFKENITALELNYKDTYTFVVNAQNIPAGAKIEWSSSNKDCVTVDANGKITAVKKGTAKITAKVSGTDTSVSCNVTVKYAWWQWIIIILLFGWIWY